MQQLGLILLAVLAVGVLAWTFLGGGFSAPEAVDSTPEVVGTAPETITQPVEAISEPDESTDSTKAAVANEETTSAAAEKMQDGNIIVGQLPFSKYLSAGELSMLGLPERDLSQTKYRADLDLDFLMSGGPPPDGIPSVDEPRYISLEVADAWLTDEDLVVGFQFNGITRAYPVGILNFHEIVNDEFEGTTVIITYCPLCNSSVAFLAPEIDGQTATFGTSGRLYLSDLVMYDRVTATFWSQMEGRPIVGPMLGVIDTLERLPIDIVPYGLWKQEHPDTEVLARPRNGDLVGRRVSARGSGTEGFLRDYSRDSYARYRNRNPGKGSKTQFGIPIVDDRLKAKDGVMGIVVNEQPKAYLQSAMLEQQLLNDVVGGVPVLAVATPVGGIKFFERTVPGSDTVLEFLLNDGQLADDQGNVWNFDGVATAGNLQDAQLNEIVGTTSFWFAWVTFNPTSETFTVQDQ